MTDWTGAGTPETATPTDPSQGATPLARAKLRLAQWEAAEDAIAAGQAYQMKNTMLTRADLGRVHDMVLYYTNLVARLTAGRTGGARIKRFIPQDL